MNVLSPRFRMKLAVFSYPQSEEQLPDPRCGIRGDWLIADADNVATLFSAYPRLRDEFLHFLERGCTGIFLVSRGMWVSYGWFSKPGTRLPHHLPASCRARADYWIFYCRTREGFRSRGCYRTLLAKMAGFIRSGDPEARIHIDTQATNAASLRAIQAAGFIPCGTIVTYKLGIPFLKWRFIHGRWQQQPNRSVFPSVAARGRQPDHSEAPESARTLAPH